MLPRHATNQRPLQSALDQNQRTENRKLKPKPVFAIEPTVPTRIAMLPPLGLVFFLVASSLWLLTVKRTGSNSIAAP